MWSWRLRPLRNDHDCGVERGFQGSGDGARRQGGNFHALLVERRGFDSEQLAVRHSLHLSDHCLWVGHRLLKRGGDELELRRVGTGEGKHVGDVE